MNRAVLAILLAVYVTSANAATPSQIGFSNLGKGCSTAYFIDKDCDGYGVAVRADGDYTTAANIGDKADADDDDPDVNTAASVLAKYGTIAAFLAHKGYPSDPTRTWYIAPDGNDTDCAANGAGGTLRTPAIPPLRFARRPSAAGRALAREASFSIVEARTPTTG